MKIPDTSFKETMSSAPQQELLDQINLLETIFNDSTQMIQVSEVETHSMIYANQLAREYTGHANQPYQGERCYSYMMGFDKPCPFCPMHQMKGTSANISEVDNGEQVFAVKTKVFDWHGKQVFVEYAWDITEIRSSERIFKSQMQTLIQSIPDAHGIFHFDLTKDICLSINGSSKVLEGFPTEANVDSVVRTIASFVPNPEEQEPFFQAFCRDSLIHAYQNGRVQVVRETDSHFDDGSIRHARITARLIMNPSTNHLECIIYGMDISEEIREKKEHELHMEEQLSIFNALARDFLNIFLIDSKHGTARILKLDGYVTTGLEKGSTHEYPYYEVCCQYINERVHPDDRTSMLNAMKLDTVTDKLSKNSEYVGSYKTLINGEKHYYQFKYIRLEHSGQIIAAFQNIDAIIASEKEQHQRLSEALEAAEHSSRAKTTFLNNMSHDIRTPLNAIIGFTELAAARLNDKPEVESYLSKIRSSSSYLLSLINDVLDMSRIESGSMKLESSLFSLPEFFEDLHTILQHDADAKQLSLLWNTGTISHHYVMSDKLRLNQVFLNILSNSVKYTNPGGSIAFDVSELSSDSDGFGVYEFCIRDTGIGMSPDFLEHIYETFSRERSSTVSGVQGTGLGMAIVKKIIDMMDGTIQVKSRPGQGTEFRIHLRLKLGHPATAGTAHVPLSLKNDLSAAASAKELFSGCRILLVEDNELNREIAVEILKEAGFSLDTAPDGTIAVDIMKHAMPGYYSLILMDIQMPKMNGYEATRQIRALPDPAIANIPILAVTANAFEEDKQAAANAGMNGHIAKPLDIHELITSIKAVLGTIHK